MCFSYVSAKLQNREQTLLQMGKAFLGDLVALELIGFELSLLCSCSTFLTLLSAALRFLLFYAFPVSSVPLSFLFHLHKMRCHWSRAITKVIRLITRSGTVTWTLAMQSCTLDISTQGLVNSQNHHHHYKDSC